MTEITLTGAQVLWPSGLGDGLVSLADGVLQTDPTGRHIDLSGCIVLPGIVDLHGDGFERHMAPRRGALRTAQGGIVAAAAEMAANGITTGVLAQFYSWEGGLRGPDFADHVFETARHVGATLATDLRLQLRLETHLLADFDRALAAVDRFGIGYVVFNDHLQHARLAEGRRPKQMTGQALKAGRNPDHHFALMLDLHRNQDAVPAALDQLCTSLSVRGVIFGSHDDATEQDRAVWAARGAQVSEFPETLAAAQAARDSNAAVIFGAPNVVRGSSHNRNLSARTAIEAGLCDALASDYHYPAPRDAVLALVEAGMCDLASGWRMISEHAARVLGLHDRGRIAPGLRADLVVLEPDTRRIGATIAQGQITYLTGTVGARFMAG